MINTYGKYLLFKTPFFLISTHKAVDRVSKRNSQTEEDRLLQLEEELLKIGEEKVSHWMETTSQGVRA